jgi:hypothetical protein
MRIKVIWDWNREFKLALTLNSLQHLVEGLDTTTCPQHRAALLVRGSSVSGEREQEAGKLARQKHSGWLGRRRQRSRHRKHLLWAQRLKAMLHSRPSFQSKVNGSRTGRPPTHPHPVFFVSKSDSSSRSLQEWRDTPTANCPRRSHVLPSA